MAVDAAEACALAMEALVRSLSSRVLDKAPSVRARAMVCLSDMLLRLRDERQRAPEGRPHTPCVRSYRPQAAERAAESSMADLVGCMRGSICAGLKTILRSLALPKDGQEGQSPAHPSTQSKHHMWTMHLQPAALLPK